MEKQNHITILSEQLESNRHMKTDEEKISFNQAYHDLAMILRNNPRELTHHVCKGLCDVSGSYEKTSLLSETIKYAHEHRETVYRQFIAEMPTMKTYGKGWIIQLLFWIINSQSRFYGFKQVLTDLNEEEKLTLLEMIEDMHTYPTASHQKQSLEEIEGAIFGGITIDLTELEAVLIANRDGRSEQQEQDFEKACIQIFAHAPKDEATIAVLLKGLTDQHSFQNYKILEHLKEFDKRKLFSVFIQEMNYLKEHAPSQISAFFENIVSTQDHVDLFIDIARKQESVVKKDIQLFIKDSIQYFEKRINHKMNQKSVASRLKQLAIVI